MYETFRRRLCSRAIMLGVASLSAAALTGCSGAPPAGQVSEAEKNFQEQVVQIDNNPSLTPKQKKAFKEQLKATRDSSVPSPAVNP